MTAAKTATVTFRTRSDIKDALCQATDGERRSPANLLDVMSRDGSRRKGLPTRDAWDRRLAC